MSRSRAGSMAKQPWAKPGEEDIDPQAENDYNTALIKQAQEAQEEEKQNIRVLKSLNAEEITSLFKFVHPEDLFRHLEKTKLEDFDVIEFIEQYTTAPIETRKRLDIVKKDIKMLSTCFTSEKNPEKPLALGLYILQLRTDNDTNIIEFLNRNLDVVTEMFMYAESRKFLMHVDRNSAYTAIFVILLQIIKDSKSQKEIAEREKSGIVPTLILNNVIYLQYSFILKPPAVKDASNLNYAEKIKDPAHKMAYNRLRQAYKTMIVNKQDFAFSPSNSRSNLLSNA